MSQSTTALLDTAFDTFADLSVRQTTHDALLRMEISVPTKIQSDTLPLLLAGRDVIGQSRTGSGKTLAFGIPAVEIVDANLRAVQVLVLTPTRELAVQVGSVLADLTQGTGMKVALVYGGRALGPQIQELRRGAQIVVGTPGRVADLYQQRALVLDKVRFLVLDEADEMLDRGFAPQVNKILSWTPSTRQTALFSATMPEWVDDASHRHLRNPAQVAVASTAAESALIDHIAYDIPAGMKMDVLRDLLDARGDGQVIVFGRTKHGVRKLAKQLAAANYPVAALQGNLSQNARDAVMVDFRAGSVPILVATNVAARGLDVSAVDYVINFELPESPELLSHRIGRTGRMGKSGQAITLLGEEDAVKWRQLERGLKQRIPRQAWTGKRRTDTIPAITTTRDSRDSQPERNYRTRVEAPRRIERQSTDRPARNDSRRDRPTHAPAYDQAPVQRVQASGNALSISVVEDMKRERRGNMAPPPPRRPELEMAPLPRNPRPDRAERTDRTESSARPTSTDRPAPRSSYNGSNRDQGTPRSSQTADSTGRPVWGSRATPPAGSSDTSADANRRRSNADKRAQGRKNPEFNSVIDSPQDSGQIYTATCTECGNAATLRFTPDLSRPIYCDSCFSARRKRSRRPVPSAV